MNDTFKWNRYCKVVAKDMHRLWPAFGTTMLILALVPSMLWLLMAVMAPASATMSADARLLIVEAMALLAAIMAPSRLYRTWNLRGEGIYFAMLPASKLEKFGSALLYSLVVCPLLVLLGGIVADMLLTLLPFGPYANWIWHGEMGFPFTFDLSSAPSLLGSAAADTHWNWIVATNRLFVSTVWMQYLANVLLFLFTSTLFRRHKVLQTLLWAYLIEFVLTLLLSLWVVFWPSLDEVFGRIADGGEQQLMTNVLWICLAVNGAIALMSGFFAWRRLDRMAY